MRTGACSKAKGPRLSAWHLKQPGSTLVVRAVVFKPKGREVPWGLWQSTQDMAPWETAWEWGR